MCVCIRRDQIEGGTDMRMGRIKKKGAGLPSLRFRRGNGYFVRMANQEL